MSRDVIIIGAGPVGMTAALLLARQGLRVDVVERREHPITEPRAVALDDEGLRIWQSCGLHDLLNEDWAGGEQGRCICTYIASDGRPFLRIRQRTSELGFPHAVAIHQGRIERKLLEAAERTPAIRIHRGWHVREMAQSPATVTVAATDSVGRHHDFQAPWVISCDGAASTTRGILGIRMVGSSLRYPWLVANVVDCGDPGHVTVRCRARGAAVTMPIPHGLRRIEVQLDDDDDGAWLDDRVEVRRRLAAVWPGAADADIVNAAICRFRAAIADRWRQGRIFLAGDAAHVMPPFAGQGLCAGLRDVANIAFKLAGASQGWLSPSVLDSYELERRPHLERITRLACRLGRLMMPPSQLEARLLPAAVRVASMSHTLGARWLLRGPSIQPRLSRGFLVPSREAGRYLPQPVVATPDHDRVMLDELLGPRMTWIVLSGHAGEPVHIEAPLLQASDSVLMEGRDFRDPDLVLRRRYGAGSAVLVRPDRVVYCHLRPSSRRSASHRRHACQPAALSLRTVREVSERPSPSLSWASVGVSPTVRTRPW